MRATVAARMWLLMGVSLGVGTSAVGFLLYQTRQVASQYDQLLNREVRLQDSARQMQVKFKIQVQEWKDVLLRGHDADALKKYSQAFEQDQAAVRGMAEPLEGQAPDPEIRGLPREFAQAHAEMGAKYAAAMQALVQGQGLNAWDVDKMVKGQDRAPTALIDRIVSLLGQRVEAQRAAFWQSLNRQGWVVLTVLLLVFGSVGAGSVLTIRGFSGTLRHTTMELAQAAERVAAAAGQVSTSSQALAQGATEQAAAVEETSASSEEITAVARANSESSRLAAGVVSESRERFVQTKQTLEQMVGAMNEIDAQSGKISKIIKVIDEIAFQTNILALNAAVEAARAGNAGVGFAVVAEEVRALAKRCAQAAQDTSLLIEESIRKTKDGKDKVGRVAAEIRTIAEESETVKTLVDNMNMGSQEQARGVEQIGKAIHEIDRVTQTTAASAEECAAASVELSTHAQAISLIVLRLRTLVHRDRNATAQHQIELALAAHALWKGRLRQAIEKRSSGFVVEAVRRDDQCAFGQWLTGATISRAARQSAGYRQTRELHSGFHRAAADVLTKALAGRKEQATRALDPTGEYARAAEALVGSLESWRAEMNGARV